MPELVEQALRKAGDSSDNVTVIALEWEGADERDPRAEVSTQDLGDQVFASTIQANLAAESVPVELDDAEIERSIQEINEAIRRSAQRRP